MKKTYIITALLSTLLCTQMSFAIETLAPKGDIETSKPTFSWQSVTGASEYKLGYENDMEEGWESYTITASSANCNSVGKVCTFTPPDINVEVGIGMVWWVKEKSNDEWKEWNDATVFTRISQNNEYELIIDDGSGVVNGSHTEQPSWNF